MTVAQVIAALQAIPNQSLAVVVSVDGEQAIEVSSVTLAEYSTAGDYESQPVGALVVGEPFVVLSYAFEAET